MSNTDSFIEEVTEEVRRDKLFANIRKYGWIAVLAVLLVVGGAAWNEWRKANAKAEAAASGDAILAALAEPDADARISALAGLDLPGDQADVIAAFLTASQQVEVGANAAAASTLETVANATGETPEVYRQIALFKAIVARGSEMPADERRAALETMAMPGAPLSLLAQEQLGLLDIEQGAQDAAIERFKRIVLDAGATAGLRQRVSQLIVALGGELGDIVPAE